MKNDGTGIESILCTIAGIENLDKGFGEPFIKAFSRHMECHEDVLAASYICSLFLSVILNGLSTRPLHTFANYTKENCRCLTFNCRMYEPLFSHMESKDLQHVVLIDKESNCVVNRCSKKDIFEAFDFYTNR
jgi:hypothetical protein